jgi:hypothetical protein
MKSREERSLDQGVAGKGRLRVNETVGTDVSGSFTAHRMTAKMGNGRSKSRQR